MVGSPLESNQSHSLTQMVLAGTVADDKQLDHDHDVILTKRKACAAGLDDHHDL